MMIVFRKMILKLLFMPNFLLDIINLKKQFKKDINKELMPVAWHPTRWQDWCMPEDEKKTKKLIQFLLIKLVDNKMLLVHVGSIFSGGMKTFQDT